MSKDIYMFRQYFNYALGVLVIIRLSQYVLFIYVKIRVCLSRYLPSCSHVPSPLAIHIPPCRPAPTNSHHPASWSLPALQLRMDRANVLLLRRTSNVHAPHSEGNKNVHSMFCSGKRRKRRDWRGRRVALRHTWTCIWLICYIWAAWLSSLLLMNS
jgi:hypothetical protein